MKREIETGSNTCLILYYNNYKELRCVLVDASTTEEGEEIATARGIKPAGIAKCAEVIKNYEKRKDARNGRKRKTVKGV